MAAWPIVQPTEVIEGVNFFHLFKNIKTPWHANSDLAARNKRPEVQEALKRYVATLGGMRIDGKFQNVYEYNPVTDEMKIATIHESGKYTIRKPGMIYPNGYDEREARERLKEKG